MLVDFVEFEITMLCSHLTFLLLVSSIQFSAHASTIANGTGLDKPECYDNTGSFPEPSTEHCLSALRDFHRTPLFGNIETFGTYPPATRLVPLKWAYGSCLVFLASKDASKTDSFALSSIVPVLAMVQRSCIDGKRPGQKYGGYAPVGNNQEFFAGFQYNPSYHSTSPLLVSSTKSNASSSASTFGILDTTWGESYSSSCRFWPKPFPGMDFLTD